MMPKCKFATLAIAVLLQVHVGAGYLFGDTPRVPQDQATQSVPITRQETLRGSVTPEREWWDVLHYHLQVEFLPETRRLSGSNTITFMTLKPGNKMQIGDTLRHDQIRVDVFAIQLAFHFARSTNSLHQAPCCKTQH
jgi:hypothetical protein